MRAVKIKLKFIIFVMLVLLGHTSYAQWLTYDKAFSGCIGFDCGPKVKSHGFTIPYSQNTVSVGTKLYGVMIQWDAMYHREDDLKYCTDILKIGAGGRHDISRYNETAVAFTPYIGASVYGAKFKELLEEATPVYRYRGFVFGTRIAFYIKKVELNFDVSNRSAGISVGFCLWGDTLDDILSGN